MSSAELSELWDRRGDLWLPPPLWAGLGGSPSSPSGAAKAGAAGAGRCGSEEEEAMGVRQPLR